MARSYKKCFNRWYRNPRGRKRAMVQGARHKAIPPDAWDDIPPGHDTQHPYRVAFALHKKGWDKDRIVNHLVKKYGYERWRVFDMGWYRYGFWRCDCDECRRW